MRRVLSIALAALVAVGASRAWAQQAESATLPASHGTLWTFDPVHGTMQATPAARIVVPGKQDRAAMVQAATPTKTYTGTIDITVTVDLISSLPKGAALRCTGTIDLEYEIEATGGTLPVLPGLLGTNNTESVDATVSGSTATCKFAIPYSWTVPVSTSTTAITINGIEGAVGIAADQLNADEAVVRSYRSTTVQLPGPTPLPRDGATTTVIVNTVL